MLPDLDNASVPDEERPAVSVIVPTYNRLDVLPSCLLCLEQQTFRNFEVIVVDDESTDGTSGFLRTYAAQTKLRFRTVRQRNKGPAGARNRAIALAAAPVVIFIGDDILPSPGFLDAHCAFHRQNTAENAAALGLTRWDESLQTVTPFMRWSELHHQFDYGHLLAGGAVTWKHFYTSNLSLKTELLRRNPFDERFKKSMMEDAELGYRLALREGLCLEFLPAAFATHVHPTDFSKSCRRARGVGEASIFFDSISAMPVKPKSRVRLAALFLLRHMGWALPFLKLANWATEQITRVWCPNPLLRPVLHFNLVAGRQIPAARNRP